MRTAFCHDYESWKQAARKLLIENVAPRQVLWQNPEIKKEQSLLFSESTCAPLTPQEHTKTFSISKEFLELAQTIACHRHEKKWTLLYSVLWRIVKGEKHLLQIEVDPEMRELYLMRKQIGRDIHKMHAFVRFKEMNADEGKRYVAWYEPDHYILRQASSFFKKRFGSMSWMILTPDESVVWDQQELVFGAGVSKVHLPDDSVETLWKTYYASIFNPARIKVKAMKNEMPVRFWKNLPETELIDGLLEGAGKRVEAMQRFQVGSAQSFVPETTDLEVFQSKIKQCSACELNCSDRHVRSSLGSQQARFVIVFDTPDELNPAFCRIWSNLLRHFVSEKDLYFTSALKKRVPTTSLRSVRSYISVCRPWLLKELDILKPTFVMSTGKYATQSILGRALNATEFDKVFAGIFPQGFFPVGGVGASDWRKNPAEVENRIKEIILHHGELLFQFNEGRDECLSKN